MTPASIAPHRWRFLILCTSLAMAGCSAGPELRASGEIPAPPSIVEGRQLLNQGRAAEAVTAFRALLRREGPDLQGLNGLAIAYSELGRPDLAAEMFSRALALSPDDPATLNNIGFSALRRADALLARHYLEKASRREGGHAEVEGNLARLALVETMERTPAPSGFAMRAAAFEPDRPRASVHHLTVPKPDLATLPPRRRDGSPSSTSTPATLIDFIEVIDPFHDRRPGTRTRQ